MKHQIDAPSFLLVCHAGKALVDKLTEDPKVKDAFFDFEHALWKAGQLFCQRLNKDAVSFT